MAKKLEGNGLWESSRMMLPQHREQLLDYRRGVVDKTPPSPQELILIRDYALLPIIISIVDKNRQQIESTTDTLRRLYVTAAHALGERIRADLEHVKKTLRSKNIRIREEERIDGTITYSFSCRGYENKFVIMRDTARAEASARISRYIASMFQ